MSSSNDNIEKTLSENIKDENIKDENIKKVEKKPKKKKNLKKRCNFEGCRKKLKLTDLACVCEKRFCSHHRIKTCHNCSTLNDRVNIDDFKQRNGLGGGEIDKLVKI